MWQREHQDETPTDAARLWRLLSDVSSWPAWNPDVSVATLDGPFAVGSTISMRTSDGGVIPLRIAEVSDGRGFVDEAELDGIVVRTDHRLDAGSAAGSTRVVYAITVSGDAPDPVLAEVGAAVSADFPATIAGLISAASR